MGPADQKVWEKLLDKVPTPVKDYIGILKERFLTAKKSTQYAIGSAGVLVLALLLTVFGGDANVESSITFEARRGGLEITVLEGGSLEALQSQEIRSRIKGREGVKILNIVEEGYQVTPEDVDAGLVLVELDKAALIDQQLNQEIAVETAEATYIERRAEYEIQLNENMTALNDARQEMRFARLEFEKFLGGNLVSGIIRRLEIEERLAKAEAEDLEAMSRSLPSTRNSIEEIAEERAPRPAFDPTDLNSMPPPVRERIEQMMAENGGELPPEMLERMQQFAQSGFPSGGPFGGQGRRRGSGGAVRDGPAIAEEAPELRLELLEPEPLNTEVTLLMDDSYMAIRDQLDFSQYADMEALEDGEAKQELRRLQDELQVSQEEYLLAQDRIEGQRRLEARGFITPTELEAEELNLSKARNKEAEKETALSLYIQYSFPKDAEEKLSDYENAIMAYQRQLKENIAEKAQEEARFSSAERKYNLERVKLADVEEQIDLATIVAERPGLVVYGAADQNQMRYRGSSSQEAIQEGATVRERQAILTIPDMREMAVKTNIHESAVQRVGVGQSVKVSIDAFPDVSLTGVVTKVAVVADSANAFMNPDLKVYPTTIKIHGVHDWLRPGMSAEVEILVDQLSDTVYVPLQAVTYWDDKRVVYVDNIGNPERREVETGTFSDSFIEIRSGLREGEKVLLLPPQQSIMEIGV
ncbi:MAG: HlyD family efflux transporter periplasmic adaptor subunit [Pseudomonadota bacterium]|nr:HlyD family efflux transporter periplasmic adaptor subunit [Pseudomonadales bacterium]MEE3289994.1 HlyD family efflux transporter periplasmic adaptor subunit [Pseudomonadota bacterium]